MESYKITAELNLKKIIAELKEVTQALNEFTDKLEQIEKEHGDPQESEEKSCTVTEFADRCRECGAKL